LHCFKILRFTINIYNAKLGPSERAPVTVFGKGVVNSGNELFHLLAKFGGDLPNLPRYAGCIKH
jgi:hypothetical protein